MRIYKLFEENHPRNLSAIARSAADALVAILPHKKSKRNITYLLLLCLTAAFIALRSICVAENSERCADVKVLKTMP